MRASAGIGRLLIGLVGCIALLAQGCSTAEQRRESSSKSAAQLRQELQVLETDYKEKIGKNPQDAELFVGLGGVLLQQSRFDEALKAYGAALDIDSLEASAFAGFG
ncbi:MAG: hypothetical protein ACJ0UT_09010, partial [Candidatus Latescibacterota bacterium]